MKIIDVQITGLDFDGRGVARDEGQVVFVAGALPQEQVRAAVIQEKKRFVEAKLLEVIKPAPERRTPPCRYETQCGGCGLQHVHDAAQMPLKTQVWLEQLARIGRVQPEQLLPAVEGRMWGYRTRARLAWQADKALLGFCRKGTQQVLNVEQCLVLPERVSRRLPELQALCALHAHAITGVALNVGTQLIQVCLSTQSALSESSLAQWQNHILQWTADDAIAWQVCFEGRGGVKCFPEQAPPLSYTLPAFGLELAFSNDDFTQIHPEVNAQMVALAVAALDFPEGAKVLDAFCGLGNFSFALAKRGAQVLGVEGVDAMVHKAQTLAQELGLSAQCRFERADLFEPTKAQLKRFADCPYWLLDPPRAGAQALVAHIGVSCKPKRVVYVSCDAGTFARDAGMLVRQGYRFRSGRLLNMFAQTPHVESLNVFERA